MKLVVRKRIKLSPSEWTSTCVECGGTMSFSETRFAYICYCGNVLEV